MRGLRGCKGPRRPAGFGRGFPPDGSSAEAEETAAQEDVAEKLGISKGSPIIRVRKLCLADGKPALYFEDMLDAGLVKEEYSKEDFKYPIFRFLEEKCNTEAYMDLTQLKAVLADADTAKILDVPQGTPLLHMDEVDYDIDGNIVFYSRQYFANGMFEQTVLRKRLY